MAAVLNAWSAVRILTPMVSLFGRQRRGPERRNHYHPSSTVSYEFTKKHNTNKTEFTVPLPYDTNCPVVKALELGPPFTKTKKYIKP